MCKDCIVNQLDFNKATRATYGFQVSRIRTTIAEASSEKSIEFPPHGGQKPRIGLGELAIVAMRSHWDGAISSGRDGRRGLLR